MKKATGILDRLKAECEKKLKSYTSEKLNEAIAEARLIEISAERKFYQVVEVMGEDIDVDAAERFLVWCTLHANLRKHFSHF